MTKNLNVPNDSDTNFLHNGITAVSMNYVDGGGTKTAIGAVAFVSGLGQYNGTELLSGAQQVSLVPVAGSNVPGGPPATPLKTDPLRVVDAIYNNLRNAAALVNPPGGVQICFDSGNSSKSGLITIGSNGRALTTKLEIKNSKDCS